MTSSRRLDRPIAALIVLTLTMMRSEAGALLSKPATRLRERSDFKRYFDDAGTAGTIVVNDLRNDTSLLYNPARARQGYLPSLTFKVPNSLIVLELGVIKDVDQDVFKWTGEPFKVNGEAFLPDA